MFIINIIDYFVFYNVGFFNDFVLSLEILIIIFYLYFLYDLLSLNDGTFEKETVN